VIPVLLRSSEGVELEARWDVPARPLAAVVFCHPHPQHRGSMTVPLMIGVTNVLVARDLAVLRFNFRGVGASTGAWDDGVGEIDDVGAAVNAARERYPYLPIGIAGWSFGAATSLKWQAEAEAALAWVGIAPPVRLDGVYRLPDPDTLLPAARQIIIGDRDQFTSVADTEDYAQRIGASVHVFKGSDHFFYFREERVGDIVADALCAACIRRER
jgi:alpha/beta superfamily hydrolase